MAISEDTIRKTISNKIAQDYFEQKNKDKLYTAYTEIFRDNLSTIVAYIQAQFKEKANAIKILKQKRKDEEIKFVSDIFTKLTNKKNFPKSQIDKVITQVKKKGLSVDDYLKDVRPYLNSGHRELIVKAMYFVAASDGHLAKKESELLMETAKVLEMTPAHVKGVLSELDKSKSN